MVLTRDSIANSTFSPVLALVLNIGIQFFSANYSIASESVYQALIPKSFFVIINIFAISLLQFCIASSINLAIV